MPLTSDHHPPEPCLVGDEIRVLGQPALLDLVIARQRHNRLRTHQRLDDIAPRVPAVLAARMLLGGLVARVGVRQVADQQ